MNHRLARDTILLLIIVGILDFIGNRLFLYWTTSWFDKLLHFASGGIVAMSAILFLQYFSTTRGISKTKLILIAISGALLVGIIWELYELYFGITFLSDGIIYITDTAGDLFFDFAGGILATKYSLLILKKYG